MQETPNANRLHIAIFGRRNAGKSSLINAITGQEIALVSEFAGTTADPVYKAMELLPIGPVVIIDTAGIDDTGNLGELRVAKTREVIGKADMALLVFSADDLEPSALSVDGEVPSALSVDAPEPPDFITELEWYSLLSQAHIPVIGVLNKCDLSVQDDKVESDNINEAALANCRSKTIADKLDNLENIFPIPFVKTSIHDPASIAELKNALVKQVPFYEKDTIVSDLFSPGDIVLLVAPQDIQAPKGRLILPQVQIMRDVLDHKGLLMTVTTDCLESLLSKLNTPPALVITDSQVFDQVNARLPEDIPLTSFSILMARYKGDLGVFTDGAAVISTLKDGDQVLIAEACTHHALQGDIGREKLPNWLRDFTGKNLDITVKTGIDFAEDLTPYSLIIHCGACMFNRKQMMSRILLSRNQKVPITNYGTAIAYMKGILPKVTDRLL